MSAPAPVSGIAPELDTDRVPTGLRMDSAKVRSDQLGSGARCRPLDT